MIYISISILYCIWVVYIGRNTCGIFYHHNAGLKQLQGRRACHKPCRTINASMHSGECFEKTPCSFHGIGKALPTFHFERIFSCWSIVSCLPFVDWLSSMASGWCCSFAFFAFCVFEDAIPVPALIRSSREGEGSCITSHDFFPKQHPACINLSLASKTEFLHNYCSKKEVSHLQSLPRNFCVDSTLSDFDFWISLFVLHQQHGQLLAPRRNVFKN